MKKNTFVAHCLLITMIVVPCMAQVPLEETDPALRAVVLDSHTKVKKSLPPSSQHNMYRNLAIITIGGAISIPLALLFWKSNFGKKDSATSPVPSVVQEGDKPKGTPSGSLRHNPAAAQLAQVMHDSSHGTSQQEVPTVSAVASDKQTQQLNRSEVTPAKQPSAHPAAGRIAQITKEFSNGKPQLRKVADTKLEKEALLAAVEQRGSLSNEEFKDLSQLLGQGGVQVIAFAHENKEIEK